MKKFGVSINGHSFEEEARNKETAVKKAIISYHKKFNNRKHTNDYHIYVRLKESGRNEANDYRWWVNGNQTSN